MRFVFHAFQNRRCGIIPTPMTHRDKFRILGTYFVVGFGLAGFVAMLYVVDWIMRALGIAPGRETLLP